MPVVHRALRGLAPPPFLADDLFARVGLNLVQEVAPRRSLSFTTRGHCVPGRAWRFYRAPSVSRRPLHCPQEPVQLLLPFEEPTVTVVFIPRSCSAFMSGRIVSYFRGAPRRVNAGRHLTKQGVCYLGDLTRMTTGEALCRLGRYGGLLQELEDLLQDLGLGLNARAPWWSRPIEAAS